MKVCYRVDSTTNSDGGYSAEILYSGVQFDRDRNGSLYDRGAADSYYERGINPHWFPAGSYNGEPVTLLTGWEKAEYLAGYEDNQANGGRKDWGVCS